ncbi:hypothetical protein U1Q18_038655 [Sarracenia purpurea var. burkii]
MEEQSEAFCARAISRNRHRRRNPKQPPHCRLIAESILWRMTRVEETSPNPQIATPTSLLLHLKFWFRNPILNPCYRCKPSPLPSQNPRRHHLPRSQPARNQNPVQTPRRRKPSLSQTTKNPRERGAKVLQERERERERERKRDREK